MAGALTSWDDGRLRGNETMAKGATLRERVDGLDVKVDSLAARVDGLDVKFDALSTRLDHQFARIDRRFERMDERFEKIDERFARMDERFEKIDERFAKIDERFEKIDERFAKIDEQFSDVSEQFAEQRRYTEFAYERLIQRMDAGFASVRAEMVTKSEFQQLDRKVDRIIEHLLPVKPEREARERS
jgi:archaellum component FlaC